MPGGSVVRLSRLHTAVLLCVLLVPFAAASASNHDGDYTETHDDSRDFVSGGMLRIHMKVGDLHIRRGDVNKIVLHYTIRSHH
jgi:hypothetical protein